MFKHLVLVFLGGGLGSVLRFVISKYLNTPRLSIPYGTLTVNIVGSLLLGSIIGWALRNNAINSQLHLTLAMGFCGGFTTFSSFAFENQALLKTGDYLHFFLYSFGSLFLGVLAIIIGLFFSKIL